MKCIKDILLKLHYLNLEVNSIYQLLLKLYEYQDMSESIIEKVLGEQYTAYKNLSIVRIKEELILHNIEYKTIICDDYPKSLQNIFMPPVVLFYQGNYSLIDSKRIAVIGARNYTDYGFKACDHFVSQLVEAGLTIVSGLARGIDSIAHRKTIEYGGKTIAVLGSGLLKIYPKENHDLAREIALNHLIVSEYPPNEGAKKTHFPFRNRIVSGLSQGVLVIEAKAKSGTLITSDYALDQSRDVYVVPGSIFEENCEGTNNLIKQGAKLVTHINDVLEFFAK